MNRAIAEAALSAGVSKFQIFLKQLVYFTLSVRLQQTDTQPIVFYLFVTTTANQHPANRRYSSLVLRQ